MSKQSQLDECRAKKEQLQAVYNGLKADYASLSINFTAAKQDLSDANARADNYYAQLQAVKDNLAAANDLAAEFKLERDSARTAVGMLEAEIADLRAALAACEAAHQPPPPPAGRFFPDASWRPYAPTAFCNTKLVNPQPKTGIDPKRSIRALAYPSELKISTDPAWNRPVYFAVDSDPLLTVANEGLYGRHPLAGYTIHVPREAIPATGTDGHLCIVNDSLEYDLWQAHIDGSTLRSSWGGVGRIDGPGTGFGATAAGFGIAGLQVRAAEVKAGLIDHALTLTADYCNGQIIPPAQGSQGRVALANDRTGRAGMGQRFWLDYTDAQIAAIQPAWQRPFARALRDYGGFIGDTGGGFIGLESPASHTVFGKPDPWLDVGIPIWNNIAILDFRAGIDWTKLKAVL
jgi:hypothetical protein